MIMDTRDLAEEREDLKQNVLDDFHNQFEHYVDQTETFEDILFDEEEIEDWKSYWQDELDEIEAIDRLEDEVNNYSGDDFNDGVTLIEYSDFQEYCEEFVRDCGYIQDDLPALIENNINWGGIADDMYGDYTEVDYRGKTYLFR